MSEVHLPPAVLRIKGPCCRRIPILENRGIPNGIRSEFGSAPEVRAHGNGTMVDPVAGERFATVEGARQLRVEIMRDDLRIGVLAGKVIPFRGRFDTILRCVDLRHDTIRRLARPPVAHPVRSFMPIRLEHCVHLRVINSLVGLFRKCSDHGRDPPASGKYCEYRACRPWKHSPPLSAQIE